ncbi:MAG: cytochrome c1 [Labrys sp. (in: a-proteobacteria)]|jgi:ubiquinol-cytochrome c reductase cytochrome c1 subunit
MTKRALGLAGFALGAVLAAASPAFAAGGHVEKPPRMEWTFAGPFGFYDDAQLQRGFKVFREVCAACHSMKKLSFRNLAEPGGPGFTEEQVKALAAEYTVQDGPNEAGEMFERPGRPSDRFPSPFPNEQAARAAMGGAYPPDMSVLAKARTYKVGFPGFIFDIFTQYQENGVDYIHALIAEGYVDPPEGFKLAEGTNYNKFMPGNQIAMAAPLVDDQVEYTDGTPQTVDQYSRDVSAFLMWAAEPHLEARKELGFKVMIFLIVFASLLYFTKKKVWKTAGAH